MRIRTPELNRLAEALERHPGGLAPDGPGHHGHRRRHPRVVRTLRRPAPDRPLRAGPRAGQPGGRLPAADPRASTPPIRWARAAASRRPSRCRRTTHDRRRPLGVAQDPDHRDPVGAGRHRPASSPACSSSSIFLNHGAGGGDGSSRSRQRLRRASSRLSHTTQQLRNLIGRGIQGYIFALLLGVLIITVEFRHKTVTTSFLVTPRRPAVRRSASCSSAALAAIVLAVILLVATVIGGGHRPVRQGRLVLAP